jgi:hypothetical protein
MTLIKGLYLRVLPNLLEGMIETHEIIRGQNTTGQGEMKDYWCNVEKYRTNVSQRKGRRQHKMSVPVINKLTIIPYAILVALPSMGAGSDKFSMQIINKP